MTQVYVVIGMTGEYSDHTEWPVKSFLNEESAKNYVQLCQRESDKIEEEYNRTGKYKHNWGNCYDEHMQRDYTGTRYYYWSVPLDQNSKSLEGL